MLADFLTTYIAPFGVLATAAATVVLAWLTGRYVRLTNQMLDETRASRGPLVYVDFEIENYQATFVVGNCGQGPAYNLSFTVEDSIPWRDGRGPSGFAALAPIREGIAYLTPGRILRFTAGFLNHQDIKEIFRSRVRFEVAYDDAQGKSHVDTILFDLKQYDGVSTKSFRSPNSDIVDVIERLVDSQSFDRVSDQIGRAMQAHCPYCKEGISKDAKKCPHCSEFLEQTS